jgi:hypothetical protein
MTVASAILYRPLLWFLIPGAMFAAWKGCYWAFDYFGRTSDLLRGIGWACMVLWFPSLLVSIVLAGRGLQRRLPASLLQRMTVTYEDATSLTAKAVAIWVTVTAIGVAGALVAVYPDAPSSVAGWLALAAPWVPSWLLFSWLRKRQSRLAPPT